MGLTLLALRSDDYLVTRDAVETGLLIAKRRHQLNRRGTERELGEARMRQTDLAALLGVAASTVANWERGKSYPGRYLGAVEALLGINLTGGQDEPDPNEAKFSSFDGLTPAQQEELREAYRAIRNGIPPARQRAG